MKKLMMAAAIVCAAVAAQAGSVKWNLYDPADPSDGYAYLFNVEDVVSADINTVIASIAEGKFATDYAGKAANQIGFDVDGIALANAITGITGDPVTLWMVAVDDASNPTKVFVGEEVGHKIGTSGSVGFTWTYGDNTTTWQSVPEPTSGLLLLLGVAGLALRRRRA